MNRRYKEARLLEPKEAYTFDYQWAIELSETQQDILWTDREIDVMKDIQDIRTNMTEAEAHGVITTLRLFTMYELHAGVGYWGNRVVNTFQRPDIQRMAQCFSYVETNVHAPFYNKLNEALNLNTDEFYLSYVKDDTLRERMGHVKAIISDPDPLASVGAFSMLEGAVLYSAFAFLMHFQSAGKNKLLNVCRGIKFSVRDENLHNVGGSMLFRELRKEQGREDDKDLEAKMYKAATEFRDHEFRIIDMIFEKGDIDGINAASLKAFVLHRLNTCLENLGIDRIFDDTGYDAIGDWFYQGINAVQFHDFFTGTGSEYNRDWDEESFVPKTIGKPRVYLED